MDSVEEKRKIKEELKKETSRYNSIIGERISTAMSSRSISQKMLAKLCTENGYPINQSSISKYINGSLSMNAYLISTICKVLNLRVDEILSIDTSESQPESSSEVYQRVANFSSQDKSSIITKADDPAFSPFLGDYNGYFFSTLNNGTIHNGIFRFYKDEASGDCHVSFTFETGEVDSNTNKSITKTYIGVAKASLLLQCIWCELNAADNSSDVSYIVFKYMFCNNNKCRSRVGLVVTICAGDKRLPVVHKLLICKDQLSDDDLSILTGQLKLNDSEILISKENYERFLKDPLLPQSFHSYDASNGGFAAKGDEYTFYLFQENSVIASKKISPEDKATVLSLLRKYSYSQRCKKIGPKNDQTVYKYLQNKQ